MGHVYQCLRLLNLAAAACLRLLGARPSRTSMIRSRFFLLCFPLILLGCRSGSPAIAIIPRACGTALWEPEHAGAAEAARRYGLQIYWNAPTRSNDVQKQIALLEKTADQPYQAMILSPDETLAFRTPIKRLLRKHLPIVVVGTELGIDSDPNLSYVLSDEVAAGQMGARRVGLLLHDEGQIAILGMDPKLWNITLREKSFETTLASEFPHIHVAARRIGQANVSQEQQTAEDLLENKPKLDALVALSAESTRGAYYALVEFRKVHVIRLIGFDQDLLPPLRTGELDSVIVENTYDMGRQAIEQIRQKLNGAASAERIIVQPRLVTGENIDAPDIQKIFSAHWWTEQ